MQGDSGVRTPASNVALAAVLALGIVLLVACDAVPPTETAEPPAREQPTVLPTETAVREQLTRAPTETPSEELVTEVPTALPLPTKEPTAAPLVGDGEALLRERCDVCHSLDRVEMARKTRDAWELTIMRMVGKGAALDAAEQAALIEYLAATYGQ